MGDEIVEPMAQTVLFNIYSPKLILLGLFLVAMRTVYTDYVVPFLISVLFSRSEDEQDYDRLAAEYERLRVEAAKVNSPDTFAQYSLIRRKMLALKRQIDVIGSSLSSLLFTLSSAFCSPLTPPLSFCQQNPASAPPRPLRAFPLVSSATWSPS